MGFVVQIGVDCISCGHIMDGIPTHELRENCVECGGESNQQCSKEALAERRAAHKDDWRLHMPIVRDGKITWRDRRA